MKKSHTKPNRLDIWGDGMMGNLPARTRKQRKRSASKQRRVILRREDNDGDLPQPK